MVGKGLNSPIEKGDKFCTGEKLHFKCTCRIDRFTGSAVPFQQRK